MGPILILARDYRDNGVESGKMAARVLRGESPGTIPFFSVPTLYNAMLRSPGAERRDLSSVRVVNGVMASGTRLHGWTLDELTSRPFVDFIHPEDRQQVLSNIGPLADGGELSPGRLLRSDNLQDLSEDDAERLRNREEARLDALRPRHHQRGLRKMFS